MKKTTGKLEVVVIEWVMLNAKTLFSPTIPDYLWSNVEDSANKSFIFFLSLYSILVKEVFEFHY